VRASGSPHGRDPITALLVGCLGEPYVAALPFATVIWSLLQVRRDSAPLSHAGAHAEATGWKGWISFSPARTSARPEAAKNQGDPVEVVGEGAFTTVGSGRT
jgi:hypothetical protein